MGAGGWRAVRREWSVMSHYQRFESGVALVHHAGPRVTYWLMRERDDRPTHP